MKELAMLNAIKLATIPSYLNEEATTYHLRSVLESVDADDKALSDPLMWTVQERIFGIAHYIASTQDDEPDFEVGEGHYSDYLIGEKQFAVEQVEIGEIEGDIWTAKPLLGYMAEAIERLHGEVEGVEGEAHWVLGLMAAQLIPNGDELNVPVSEYEAALYERMKALINFPESIYVQLLGKLKNANQEMCHLFDIWVEESGIVILPKRGAKLPNARFPASTTITSVARYLSGKPQGTGS